MLSPKLLEHPPEPSQDDPTERVVVFRGSSRAAGLEQPGVAGLQVAPDPMRVAAEGVLRGAPKLWGAS